VVLKLNTDPFGVLETGPRKLRDGHIMRVDKSCYGRIRIYCEGIGCKWFTDQLIENREMAEYLAWRHRTEPQLLLPGSSDVLKPTRLQVVRNGHVFG
jgi:hypothetical protein